MHHVFHKNIKQLNCFNIDNSKKLVLSSKTAYWNDFLSIMWQKTGETAAENVALPSWELFPFLKIL